MIHRQHITEQNMNLKQIARKNQKLRELYEEISNAFPIIEEKSSSNYWGAHIDTTGNAVITYAKIKNQLAALAHELLHIKMQMLGYKRLKCVATISMRDKQFAKTLIDALDNELQHHKMYPYYSEMGFLREDFFCDEDKEAEKRLFEIMKETRPVAIDDLLLDYLTLISPGGSISNKKVVELKTLFRSKLGNSTPFDVIDSAFEQWCASKTMDSELIVSQIFKLIQNPTETWVGYDDGNNFPKNGFFIDKIFTLS
jgi:hypothetical protein